MNRDNNISILGFASLWFGAAISIAEILTGGLLAPLGFKLGLTAVLTGHLIGTSILVLGGAIGTEERLPSMTSVGIAFGSYGSGMFSVLNILQLVGWTAVMIISGARSINEISKALWTFDGVNLWCIAIGGLICLWILFGKGGWKKLNFIAVILLFLLTIVLSTVVFRDNELLQGGAVGTMSFGSAVELNVIMPLSWLPLIADYTRFAKRKRDGVVGSFIGYFMGSSWMYVIGLGAALVAGNPDPGAMMLAADLGLAALGIVILSTVTTTFMDAYSAGVSFQNIFQGISERKAALAMGIAGTLVAMVLPIEQYQNFLYAIGSVFAPLFAVLLAEYFIIRKNNKLQPELLVNWGAVIVWFIGVVLYYQFIKLDLIFGATFPIMFITAAIHTATWRITDKWKLLKKQQSC